MKSKRIQSLPLTVAMTASLLAVSAQAAETFWKAYPSTQPICLNGRQVQMTAYNINGSNYVKLRDVGELVGFNVYWDGATVQVDSGAPYTGKAPAASTSAAQDAETIRQEIVIRTNAVRVENGLKVLPTDPLLMKAAQVRAEEMAATGAFSHTRPDGSGRLTATDCPYTSENICRVWQNNLDYRGVGLAEQSVNGWAASAGHFRNMTDGNCGAIGVGVAEGIDGCGERCWYCVQWFLREGQHITWVDVPQIP